MNFTKDIECINCGKIMERGSTNIGVGFSQFRYCSCGLEMFLFNKIENYNWRLQLVLKGKDNL
jgi:hypothetical protein